MQRSRYVSTSGAALFASRSAFLASSLPDRPVKLLDVGNLGDGDVKVNVRGFVEEKSGMYYGLDVNENLARQQGYERQLIGDLHDLAGVVDDESFDCIYMGEVIEHSWYPDRMVSECYRILRPDGILILNTPNVFDLWNVLRNYLLRKDTLGLDHAELVYNEAVDNFKQYREVEGRVLSQPQHKILFGPAMLRQILNMNAFIVERLSYIGKRRNLIHGMIISVVPQASQYLGVVARKSTLESVFQREDAEGPRSR